MQFKESENVAICILDAGLEEKQKEALLDKDEIKSAEWDIEVHKIKGKEWLKSQVSRFFTKILSKLQDLWIIVTLG